MYRLMALSKTGTIYQILTGSIVYLQRIAAQGKPECRGRRWIELNVEPATLPAGEAVRRHRA